MKQAPFKSPNKFNARTVMDPEFGRFHSQREHARFTELKLLEAAGQIRDLRRQVPFPLRVTAPDGQQIMISRYFVDFVYIVNGAFVYEDTKGFRERLYAHKKKHIEAQMGIEILET